MTKGIARTRMAVASLLLMNAAAIAEQRPNILWLSSEDHGPHMGCYGDAYANTPNIDRLAKKGMIYTRVWSCAPVCAPARTTLISGLYPTSTGSEHMRSMVSFPAGKVMFPRILRESGYYCTNNAKEDYNLTQTGKVWDESSRNAHWRNRKKEQPFFAVFNSTRSHESQIRARPHQAVHDPAKARIPKYHPDTPEVRGDWAQYHDVVSLADEDAGRHLKEIEDAGLEEETIVFYFADHGSGMPRNKRFPGNAGLSVPLVVYIPEKFRVLRPSDHAVGGKSDRRVGFVDFAPTVLGLAGIKPPEWMQGRAFLGAFPAPEPDFLFGFRGRMDERYDLIRSVTDGRYVYIRNYMPHLPHGQHLEYMFQTPTTRVWKERFDQGRLSEEQSAFWKTKPPEELYDTDSDPDEVTNLADSTEHVGILTKLRDASKRQALAIRDVGFLPEGEIHSRSLGSTPHDMGHDPRKYPLERILMAAESAASFDASQLPTLRSALQDPDSAVRYWGAMGFLVRGQEAKPSEEPALVAALDDESPFVRIVAAETVAGGADRDLQKRGAAILLDHADRRHHDVFAAMAALNAIDRLQAWLPDLRESALKLPAGGPVPHARYAPYVPRLIAELMR